jgi:8-oxo-dGTP diphosphatase
VLEALHRELLEEVGLTVIQAESMLTLEYDYPEKRVLLDVWLVTECEGEGQGLEGQLVAWVPYQQLSDYQFPDANQPILTAVAGLF